MRASVFSFTHRTIHSLLGVLLLFALLGCESESEPEHSRESINFLHQGNAVEVTFLGERSSEALFGPDQTLLDQVRPLSREGEPEGSIYHSAPDWLEFEYTINDQRRQVLVAKTPLMNHVSWLAIARAGAAWDDDTLLRFQNQRYRQSARVTDTEGNEYQVRLPSCGRSTHAHLSEWNLLIGGVHEGDMDFSGERYGWIQNPYSNEDLKVGLNGSLNWCQEGWRNPGSRVTRGYYFVSRFHAAPAPSQTDRLFWRPVLERVSPADEAQQSGAVAVERDVKFLGTVAHNELLGSDQGLAEQLDFHEGDQLEQGKPDWLVFKDQGTTKWVAAKPIAYSLSWNALAQAGLVKGDGSELYVDGRGYPQNAELRDTQGNRYRVRLLQCGNATLDHEAEWNRLIGAVARPDGDFAQYPEYYGWVEAPLKHEDLNIGAGDGAASWCQERLDLYGKPHGVNRGFLVPSRYHATDTRFNGWGFGWRPVLERVD